MKAINPYLNFPGTAEEAFNFYKSIFGGDFIGGINRFKDMPESDKIPENEKDKIMHISLPIGNGNILMASDSLESMGYKVTAGTNFHLTIEAESKEEADKFFKDLSEGGKITMPMEDTFWGAYFGMLTDKFGINWMVDYTYENQEN
jgi:PhnB protein